MPQTRKTSEKPPTFLFETSEWMSSNALSQFELGQGHRLTVPPEKFHQWPSIADMEYSLKTRLGSTQEKISKRSSSGHLIQELSREAHDILGHLHQQEVA